MYNTKSTAWHTVGLHCDFCLNSVWGASMFQTPNLAPHALSHFILSCCVLVAQSCPTLCDPMDYSPPGSSLPGMLQARILGWVAMPSSRRSSQSRDQTQVSCIAARFFTIWATREALVYMQIYGLTLKQNIVKQRLSFESSPSQHYEISLNYQIFQWAQPSSFFSLPTLQYLFNFLKRI